MKPSLLFTGSLVVAAVFTCCSAAQAQGVRLGLKAGANLSRYAGEGTENFDNLVGLHGGLVLNAPVSSDQFFSIQPELLYVQKGSKVMQSGINTVFTSRLHYLDLPILARIHTGGFFVEAGPQLGYLLSQEGRFTGAAQSVTYQRLDFGYIAGVGYQLKSGPNAGLRFNGGLSDLFDEVIGGTVNPRNSSFQAYVGYLFGGN